VPTAALWDSSEIRDPDAHGENHLSARTDRSPHDRRTPACLDTKSKNMPRRIRLIAISSVLAVGVVASGGYLVNAATAPSATITACSNTKTGAVRVIAPSKSCSKTEKRLTWNVKGATGAAGATGKTGAPGPAGPAGKAGKDGVSGFPGLDGKDGLQGPAGQDGKNGHRRRG
jgi:hypothetical protein